MTASSGKMSTSQVYEKRFGDKHIKIFGSPLAPMPEKEEKGGKMIAWGEKGGQSKREKGGRYCTVRERRLGPILIKRGCLGSVRG